MLDQLKRRGMAFANRCFLCQEKEELLFSLFGVYWVISSSVRDTLLGWRGSLVTKDQSWKAGLLCLFWVVWKTRNHIVYKNKVFIQKLKHFFVHLLWSEIKFVDGPRPFYT